MRVLMLTPYLPYPLYSGGQIRTYNLLKQLSAKHDITLFSLIKHESEKQHVKELEKYCSEVKVFKRSEKPFTIKNILRTGFSSFPFLVMRNHVPEVIAAVREYLAKKNPDLIHAETFYMMPHIPETSIPIILVEQTIEYLGYESYAKKAPAFLRPLLSADIAKIKYWEKHYWESCDKLIVMSEDDKRFVETQLGETDKTAVVENGVATQWFQEKKRENPEHPTVLSVGTFKWLPNIEAATFLVEKVWPLVQKQIPTAKLWIVGNEPTPNILKHDRENPDITVTGRIPDIRDAFRKASVLVAPVFSGKGTRYKVLEAMATGTPVIATPTAVEGLSVTDAVHCKIGKSAQELADHTVSLLKNKQERQRLARNGKRFVGKHFDWELIAKKLDTIYKYV